MRTAGLLRILLLAAAIVAAGVVARPNDAEANHSRAISSTFATFLNRVSAGLASLAT